MYTKNRYAYSKRPSHEVRVGKLFIGGDHPLLVQSMVISDTLDTDAVVEEAISLAAVGCQLIRVTAPTIKHAENLKLIRESLNQKGFQDLPLVADIHFAPNAAMVAAQYVEKVRINPGNFVDRKLFKERDYTDEEYQAELHALKEKFIPLVRLCQERGVAMRIGTNHGSLSDRIMNRYGDTPLGMVESALEFLRVCEELNYDQVVLSMKASNTQVMVQAYRLLVEKLAELNWTYPIHLGVTEAGDGEDGRIKSSIGILSLLQDGIGDTLRVSLTEDAIHEIPVARELARPFEEDFFQNFALCDLELSASYDPYAFKRRSVHETRLLNHKISENEVPLFALNVTWKEFCEDTFKIDFMSLADKPELLILEGINEETDLGDFLGRFKDRFPEIALGVDLTQEAFSFPQVAPYFDLALVSCNPDLNQEGYFNQAKEIINVAKQWPVNLVWKIDEARIPHLDLDAAEILSELAQLSQSELSGKVLLAYQGKKQVFVMRKCADLLAKEKLAVPFFVQSDNYFSASSEEYLFISGQMGSLLLDGLGDVFSVSSKRLNLKERAQLTLNILQGSRARFSKTEYIACPSCGRTVFDLQSTTQKIKAATSHLKGVKIGVMGCIVNGPGEMADADFGYVGAGPGKIHLYVGQDCVEKNIASEQAVGKLIDLIKSHGKWVNEKI